MELLERLQADGLRIALVGNRIVVSPKERITDEHREAIRRHRDEIANALASGNPLMTKAQADACHADGWTDDEIMVFTQRTLLFVQRGSLPGRADDLAERLVLRDRERDERRHCLECSNWRRTGCDAGGPLDALMRCGAFEEMPHDPH